METEITEKIKALNMIDALPPESTYDDIFYALYVQSKVELGLKDLINGNLLEHEEIVKELEL